MHSRELVKILREHGCEFIRFGKGDHQVWYSPITGRKFTIVHPVKELAKGTLKSIKKQAGI